MKLTKDQYEASGEEINRVLHIAKDPSTALSTLTHAGALQRLSDVASVLRTNDFVVLDIVLEQRASMVMSSILLSSTIWFDVTNGQAFASHSDDGLVYSVFYDLSQVFSSSD